MNSNLLKQEAQQTGILMINNKLKEIRLKDKIKEKRKKKNLKNKLKN